MANSYEQLRTFLMLGTTARKINEGEKKEEERRRRNRTKKRRK